VTNEGELADFAHF